MTDLRSAVSAIQLIVEQGEGSRGGHEESHYQMFLNIQREYQILKEHDAEFEPGRPVLENPFTRMPADAQEVNLLQDSLSSEICDLFNGTYEVMVQALLRFFAHGEEGGEELKLLIGTAVGAMVGVLKRLGELITTLPAGDAYPGMIAGPSFQFYRSVHLLPHKHSAWIFLHERLLELTDYCEELKGRSGAPPILGRVQGCFCELAGALEKFID